MVINTLTCVRIMNDITVNLLMKCRKYANNHNNTKRAEEDEEEAEKK